MPVQRLCKMAVADADKRSRKPAAGAGEARHQVKGAQSGYMRDLAVRAWHRHNKTGEKHPGQNRKQPHRVTRGLYDGSGFLAGGCGQRTAH